jgi:predicted amidohydrolase
VAGHDPRGRRTLLARSIEVQISVIQMTSGDSLESNVARAAELVASAAQADLVVLPERWNLVAGTDATRSGAEPLDGSSLQAARGWALQHEIHLLAGSIAERSEDPARPFNTSVLIGPDGSDLAVYRKLHLFDVVVGGAEYRESAATGAGSEIVVGEVDGVGVGLSVCYDLRFPELFRALTLRGAQILAVPAAFTAHTGPAHWEVLLRARAIEDQSYVVAAGQVGVGGDGRTSHGHSMIVDPWGVVIAEVEGGEGVATAEISTDRVAEVRETLPSLAHRRIDVYGDPT